MIGNGEIKASIAGEMYIVPADAYQLSITQLNTFVRLENFNKSIDANMSVNEVDGKFTAEIAGLYLFGGVASLFPSSGMLLTFVVFVNDTFNTNISSSIDFQNSQDTKTFSGRGFINLNKGDVIDVRGKSNTQPVTVSIATMNIGLHRVGNLVY